jgi:hypothetical protein
VRKLELAVYACCGKLLREPVGSFYLQFDGNFVSSFALVDVGIAVVHHTHTHHTATAKNLQKSRKSADSDSTSVQRDNIWRQKTTLLLPIVSHVFRASAQLSTDHSPRERVSTVLEGPTSRHPATILCAIAFHVLRASTQSSTASCPSQPVSTVMKGSMSRHKATMLRPIAWHVFRARTQSSMAHRPSQRAPSLRRASTQSSVLGHQLLIVRLNVLQLSSGTIRRDRRQRCSCRLFRMCSGIFANFTLHDDGALA